MKLHLTQKEFTTLVESIIAGSLQQEGFFDKFKPKPKPEFDLAIIKDEYTRTQKRINDILVAFTQSGQQDIELLKELEKVVFSSITRIANQGFNNPGLIDVYRNKRMDEPGEGAIQDVFYGSIKSFLEQNYPNQAQMILNSLNESISLVSLLHLAEAYPLYGKIRSIDLKPELEAAVSEGLRLIELYGDVLLTPLPDDEEQSALVAKEKSDLLTKIKKLLQQIQLGAASVYHQKNILSNTDFLERLSDKFILGLDEITSVDAMKQLFIDLVDMALDEAEKYQHGLTNSNAL